MERSDVVAWTDWLRDRPYHDGQLVAHRSIPGSPPTYRELELDPTLERALKADGIERLYSHQVSAIEGLRAGNDVVISTPTASGKTLSYLIPAAERAIRDAARTLYIAPQNALVADQCETFQDLEQRLGFGSRFIAREYTGRTSTAEKEAVRERRPTVLVTTPDMLHYGILPHARRLWPWFLRGLSLVIVDEAHTYRGVFGSHVSLILRRLNRVAAHFDAHPQYVCSSATIGNPVEHAAQLTGRPRSSLQHVGDDASEHGRRTWGFWNPPEHAGGHGRRRSSHVESMRLLIDLVEAGHQTLVFCRSRQGAERYALETQRRLRDRGSTDLSERIAAYEGALSHDRRRAIEQDVMSGEIRAVWSTSALELGVDIGGLDAVILDGYPGTRTATHQRAGRAGRGADESLVIVVAGEDQLDQYVMAHPETLFDTAAERAVVDPSNTSIRSTHLRAAARESWLTPADTHWFGANLPAELDALASAGTLTRRETRDGERWLDTGGGSPHHDMSIRTIDADEVALIRHDTGERLGTLSRTDAMRDAHRGAIYHHQGQAFEVIELDLAGRRAELSPTWATAYTSVRHRKTIMLHEVDTDGELSGCPEASAGLADLSVRIQITGFVRKDARSGEVLSEEPLDMPETTLETEGLFLTIPPALQGELTESGDFLGGIHAAEHALISLFPLEVLCDRGDIGGLSTPYHGATSRATIFVYDGHPGGVGLTRAGYDRIETMLERTAALIEACPCADGCPACVHSPQCGNGNEPLDPETACDLLAALLGVSATERNNDREAV